MVLDMMIDFSVETWAFLELCYEAENLIYPLILVGAFWFHYDRGRENMFVSVKWG